MLTIPRQLADEPSRRRRAAHRDRVEQLLDDAGHFTRTDRVLIEQVYRHHVTYKEVAVLLGMSVRAVQVRLNALLNRTRQPLFRFVVDRHELLPRELRAVSRRAVLEGRSLRETARLTGLSLHHVRQRRQALRVLAGQ